MSLYAMKLLNAIENSWPEYISSKNFTVNCSCSAKLGLFAATKLIKAIQGRFFGASTAYSTVTLKLKVPKFGIKI